MSSHCSIGKTAKFNIGAKRRTQFTICFEDMPGGAMYEQGAFCTEPAALQSRSRKTDDVKFKNTGLSPNKSHFKVTLKRLKADQDCRIF